MRNFEDKEENYCRFMKTKKRDVTRGNFNSSRESSCEGKSRMSRGAAREMAAKFEGRAYKCDYCHQYHVTAWSALSR